MKVEQYSWAQSSGWSKNLGENLSNDANLLMLFGSRALLEGKNQFQEIKTAYPNARLVGCSTSGEIFGTEVKDDTLSLTAVNFEKTDLKFAKIGISETSSSSDAGKRLGDMLPHGNLSHVFILSDGLGVNGTDLSRGLSEVLPKGVSVTGGLSGDGAEFGSTVVALDDDVQSGVIVAVGFYGDNIKVGYGSKGGWSGFGPIRQITKSEGGVLHELDGEPALDLYKKYLGEHADGLPATGLLFPLVIRNNADEVGLVRTILAVDEDNKTMTFAGDIPQGAQAQLMKSNIDQLVDGAVGAAQLAKSADQDASLAVLISCVGRKLVMSQRVEEEIEEVQEVLGDSTTLTGFYSYGELAPFRKGGACELHNQTMTITTFHEA